MNRAEDIGTALGRFLAAHLPAAAQEAIRERYRALYGSCRRCGEPLGGPSPSQVCEGCHVDEALAAAAGPEASAPDA